MHGHTYLAHPVACAAALAVQQTIRDEGLLPRVRARGAYLRDRLRARFGDHPHVGDIRGRGLFWAVELVKDRATNEPFDPAAKLHARVKQAAFAGGLACYPMGGTIDGVRGDHVVLAPPYIVSEGEIDLIVDRLAAAIDTAVGEIGVG
jgi:adenosylmethionine-8-amino-7-oxononanoate aminotransferase